MNVKLLMSLVLALMTNYISNERGFNNLNFKEIDVIKKSKFKNFKTFKLTTYYTPVIHACRQRTSQFKHRINVYKNGKDFSIYINNSKELYVELYVEGFVKVILPDTEFFLDHEWNWQPYAKNSKGGWLTVGQAASNYLSQGTRFVYKGDTLIITDVGGGLSKIKPHIDIFTNNYSKSTVIEKIEIL